MVSGPAGPATPRVASGHRYGSLQEDQQWSRACVAETPQTHRVVGCKKPGRFKLPRPAWAGVVTCNWCPCGLTRCNPIPATISRPRPASVAVVTSPRSAWLQLPLDLGPRAASGTGGRSQTAHPLRASTPDRGVFALPPYASRAFGAAEEIDPVGGTQKPSAKSLAVWQASSRLAQAEPPHLVRPALRRCQRPEGAQTPGHSNCRPHMPACGKPRGIAHNRA